MYGKVIETKLRELLYRAGTEPIHIPEVLIEKFGDRCKASVRRKFNDEYDSAFRLRMSNVGKDLRSLWLEKEYGREPMDYATVLKLSYGDLIENLLLMLIESVDGLPEIKVDESVSIKVGGVEVKGKYDLSLGKEIIDIKTASPFAYDNKFESYEKLRAGDDFGYIEQLFGYSFGTSGEAMPSGWLVVNKVNGELKFLEVPPTIVADEAREARASILKKVDVISNNKVSEVPACTGVEAETWRNKETGRLILNSRCMWCRHKGKCHPNGVYRPSFVSKAANKQNVFYVKLNTGDV